MAWLSASLMTIGRSNIVHNIFSIISIWDYIYIYFFFFAHWQVPPKRIVLNGPKLNSSEILCVSCKFEDDPVKYEGAIVSTTFSPLCIWQLLVDVETKVLNESAP